MCTVLNVASHVIPIFSVSPTCEATFLPNREDSGLLDLHQIPASQHMAHCTQRRLAKL